MNFLAHWFLSGDSDDIKLGNFMGDWIKGKQYLSYSEQIQQGVLLHRFIDDYADKHEIFKKGIKRLRPAYGKYAGVVNDIFYDHLLIHQWKKYTPLPLNLYIENIHQLLLKHCSIFPEKLQKVVPILINNNRLASYQYLAGLKDALMRMKNYAGLPDKATEAIEILTLNYKCFLEEFDVFFEEIIPACKKFNLNKLKNEL